MRPLTTAGALLLAALGFAAPEGRASSLDFTSFWTLGDSLSDDGNLFATGVAIPSAPYFEGRFSDGPVWAEHIAGDFEAEGKATGIFAYGYAAVGPAPFRPVGAPPVEDLSGQIGLFADASDGKLGKRPLASLWFGANDLFFSGVPTGNARQVGRAAARGVADGALALRDLGVNDVVLFNLPALDKTPNYRLIYPDLAEQARVGTKAFNRTLDRRADVLRNKGMNVIEVDMFALFNELLDDPAKFGVLDATTPCFVPSDPPVYCGDALAPLLAFFDPVHPSSTIHAAIADVVRGEIAPVPLPAPAALLVAALAGMALVRRRAQGSRIA